MTKNINSNGYIFAILGGIILSFDTVLIRMINFLPEQIAFWRSLSMCLPGLSILIYQFTSRTNDINITNYLFNGKFALSAFFYGLSSILFPVAAMTTSIANMLFIISTAPLWAAILSWFVTKERVSVVTLCCFIVSIIGVTIVIVGSGFNVAISFGDISALGTAITMAAAFVVGRTSKQDLSLAPAIGSIFSAICIFIFFQIELFIDWYSLMLVIVEGSIIMFCALSLIAKSSNLIPPVHLGFFLMLETVLGPIWIWLTFNETPNIYAILGGVIILSGLLVNSWFAVWKTKSLQ